MGNYKRACLFGLILFVTFTTLVMVLMISGSTVGSVSKYFPTMLVEGLARVAPTSSISTSRRMMMSSWPFQNQASHSMNSSLNATVVMNIGSNTPAPAPPKQPLLQPTNRPMTCNGCFFSDFPTLSDNPDLCSPSTSPTSESSSSSPELVMMITTSLDGLERRQAIRSTWASVSRNNTGHVRHVFLLGTGSDGKVSDDIMAESARYRDMVISDFVDTYGNLTYKTMAGLRWIVKHCGDAKFFMKTDQDMYIFVERILRLAKNHESTLMKSIGGSCYQKAEPWRNPKTKYYASIRSYPQPTYPGFCSGTGYVSTLNLARKIVDISPEVPFFHLEDVYLALVIKRLGYKLTRYDGFAAGAAVCSVPKRARGVYTIHDLSPAKIRQMWQEKCGV